MLNQNTIIDDVCGLIGFSATVRLIEWYGGRHVYIPEHATDDHPLALLLGCSALRALSSELGSTMVWVPRDVAGKRKRGIQTKKAVARLLSQGCIVEQAAASLGVSTRQVRRIAQELKEFRLVRPKAGAPGE